MRFLFIALSLLLSSSVGPVQRNPTESEKKVDVDYRRMVLIVETQDAADKVGADKVTLVFAQDPTEKFDKCTADYIKGEKVVTIIYVWKAITETNGNWEIE